MELTYICGKPFVDEGLAKLLSKHIRFELVMVDERLLQFLNNGKDWERKQTSIPGIFLLRLPSFKGRKPSICVEVNPVDSSGAPTKKRGVVVRSSTELEEIRKILDNEKIVELMKKIEEVNPKEVARAAKSSDVYEV